MARTVRLRWRRPTNSAQPSLDALAVRADASDDRLRLITLNPPKPVSMADRQYMLRLLQCVLVIVVFGQRIVVPLGSTAISLPLIAAFLGIVLARLRGGIRRNRVRTELYLASGTAIVACAWLSSWRGGRTSRCLRCCSCW